jgi:trk system potassium uptake protein TrkA
MVIIVVANANLGPALVAALERRGQRVTLVAPDDATPAGLLAAGATHADLLIAAAERDEANLIAAALARREFGVRRVIARAHDASLAWLYTPELGVDAVLDEVEWLARLAAGELNQPAVDELARLQAGGLVLVEETLPADSAAGGRPLAEVALPPDSTAVAVWRDGAALPARGDLVLQAGDALVALVRGDQAGALGVALGPPAPPPHPSIEVIRPAVPEGDTLPIEGSAREDIARWRRPAEPGAGQPDAPGAEPAGAEPAGGPAPADDKEADETPR